MVNLCFKCFKYLIFPRVLFYKHFSLREKIILFR